MSDRRYEANLALLVERLPGLAVPGADEGVELARDAAGAVSNVRIDGRDLYEMDAREFAARQIEAYLADPTRFQMVAPMEFNVTGVNRHVLAALVEAMRVDGGMELGAASALEAGALVVFGLGLGLHVEALAERLDPELIIVVEEHGDLLGPALAAADWGQILNRRDGSQRAIKLVVGVPNAAAAELEIEIAMRGRGHLLDGLHLFRHFSSLYYDTIMKEFWRQRSSLSSIDGYYEDEKVMLTNALWNFTTASGPLMCRTARLAVEPPLLVVASGPSIDGDIAELKARADDSIVLSCGSGLGVCLRNGVTPDFHVEFENMEIVADNLALYEDSGFLDKTIFLAASTVSPRAVGRFRETWLYFRGSSAGDTIGRGKGDDPPPLPSPLVANAGVSLGVMMGFRQVVLLGVDCGSRTAEQHSRSSFYHEVDALRSHKVDYTEEIPGNFGGTVASSTFHVQSRNNLTTLTRSWRGVDFVNCSDGAAIPGFRPLPLRRLARAPMSAGGKRAAIDAIRARCCATGAAARRAEREDVARLKDAARDLVADLVAAYEELESGDAKFGAAAARASDRVAVADGAVADDRVAATVRCCFAGPVRTQATLAASLRNQLRDRGRVEAFDRMAGGLLKDACAALGDDFAAYLTQLDDDIAAGAFRACDAPRASAYRTLRRGKDDKTLDAATAV